MPRNVFFSFDFDDIMAVNVVRNSNVVREVNAQLPFRDKSIYEAARNTPGAVRAAIDKALSGSSVTVVLNGPATANSYWVRYEIARSFERGNGFIVVDLTGVGPAPCFDVGPNPLAFVGGVSAPNSTTVDVHELNGRWLPHDVVKTFSKADAGYPPVTVEGNFNLAQRFPLHFPWQKVQQHFSLYIESAASAAGWPPIGLLGGQPLKSPRVPY